MPSHSLGIVLVNDHFLTKFSLYRVNSKIPYLLVSFFDSPASTVAWLRSPHKWFMRYFLKTLSFIISSQHLPFSLLHLGRLSFILFHFQNAATSPFSHPTHLFHRLLLPYFCPSQVLLWSGAFISSELRSQNISPLTRPQNHRPSESSAEH